MEPAVLVLDSLTNGFDKFNGLGCRLQFVWVHHPVSKSCFGLSDFAFEAIWEKVQPFVVLQEMVKNAAKRMTCGNRSYLVGRGDFADS